MKEGRKVFLSIFFMLSSLNIIFAVENPLLKMSAKVCCYELNKKSYSSEIECFSSFFDFPFKVLASRHWTVLKGSVPLFDLLVPSYEGFIAFIYSYEPLIEDEDLIQSFFLKKSGDFTVQKPKELEQKIDFDSDLNPILIEDNKIEKTQRDSSGNLSFFSVDDEILSMQNLGTEKIIVRKWENHLIRKFYDEKMRLKKRESWNISTDFSDSSILKTENFFYTDDSLVPVSCQILESNKFSELSYDDKGRVVDLKESSVQDEKRHLQNHTAWHYDEKNRITEKQTKTYIYKKENFSKAEGTHSQKEVYIYKIEDGQPDYYYYENNELKLKTEYSSQNDYITTMNFDNGFIVESFYKNGMRKKDIYYLNGVVRRVKQYE